MAYIYTKQAREHGRKIHAHNVRPNVNEITLFFLLFFFFVIWMLWFQMQILIIVVDQHQFANKTKKGSHRMLFLTNRLSFLFFLLNFCGYYSMCLFTLAHTCTNYYYDFFELKPSKIEILPNAFLCLLQKYLARFFSPSPFADVHFVLLSTSTFFLYTFKPNKKKHIQQTKEKWNWIPKPQNSMLLIQLCCYCSCFIWFFFF